MQTYLEFYVENEAPSNATKSKVKEIESLNEMIEEIPVKEVLVQESQHVEDIQEKVYTVKEKEESLETEHITETREILHNENITPEIIGYKVYRDKTETFKCDVEISGAKVANSKSRIIIEGDELTYMFEGTINEKGECKIPLRKMSFLNEYEQGRIKLEIIADDMIFCPWESEFTAVNAKKAVVKVIESVDTTPKVGVKVTKINGI